MKLLSILRFQRCNRWEAISLYWTYDYVSKLGWKLNHVSKRGTWLPIMYFPCFSHWGWVTHICVSKIIIIGSNNSLWPGRRQASIWTNTGMLLIGPLGINFSEILIDINKCSFKKMHLKISSVKWRRFRLGLDRLMSDADVILGHPVSEPNCNIINLCVNSHAWWFF